MPLLLGAQRALFARGSADRQSIVSTGFFPAGGGRLPAVGTGVTAGTRGLLEGAATGAALGRGTSLGSGSSTVTGSAVSEGSSTAVAEGAADAAGAAVEGAATAEGTAELTPITAVFSPATGRFVPAAPAPSAA